MSASCALRMLESLGNELGLGKEPVRRLQATQFGKMRKTVQAQLTGERLFLAV